MKTGIFRRIFVAAEAHRFHHLKGKPGDAIFGLFFHSGVSLWVLIILVNPIILQTMK